MIKNIVFDLGGVLVDFKPENLLRHLEIDEEEIPVLVKIIFYGEEWGKYNSSIYDQNETRKKIIENNSEYADRINYIFDNMDFRFILFEMTDTAKYLKSLKENGYNIYLLSDLSKDSFDYNASMEFFEFVEGGIYSFEVGSTKPSDNNYQRLLGDFNLIPDETIFIDDRLNNIEAANKFGIHGIQFTTLDEVKEKVNELIKG